MSVCDTPAPRYCAPSHRKPLMKRLSLSFLLFQFLFAAALPARTFDYVAASLVSEDASIKAGEPFTVALRFVHKPHWHTYWVNPGTGLATTLKWTLPPGWSAGDIQWPAPKLLSDSRNNIIGNGYDGDLLLPVTITPPADLKAGTSAEITVSAEWLMCQDECVPGNATLSLVLPVSAEGAQPDPVWAPRIQAVVAQLPVADPSWKAYASRGPATVTLVVRAEGAPADSARLAADLHFFSEDGTTAYDQPEIAAQDGKGGFTLTLPIASDAPKDAPRLVGVLTSKQGWRPDGSLPGLRIDVPFGAIPAEVAAPPPTGFLGTLVLAFVGGLILNLMPCVFPVLGIKILGFVNQSGADRKKVTLHGIVFTAGVLVSFWVLAGILAVLRTGGAELGWGFQLQSPTFVFALAAAMLAFALNMSGVFEFGLTATGIGSGLQSKSGLMGSFLTGALATVAATPCAAPFLAPALGAALALPVAQSFAIFTVIGIGLSAPYLLLSAFPSAVKILPRPGAWMETFKQAMAFPLYATVAYLVWVLAGQLPDTGLLFALFGLVLVAMGVWVYGRWTAPGASPGRVRFGQVACIVLLALGAWAGRPVPAAPTDIVWDKWSPEAVEKLRADNRIIYVDFTARWCATCQANKRLVFHGVGSDEVLKAFREKHVATLEGDWTNKDPQITTELAKYHRAAVPFNLIWVPGSADPVILPELLTPSAVLGALPK
jgi:DsbC/DsbD-like thiol-disulfide interchange protein/cytochrome c biogenesis protein CcdA